MSKQDILDAAKSLLWRDGYASMSPRKVMDASGAGQGSLYHHFRSKAALAEAALDAIADELIASAELLFTTDLPPMDLIGAYLTLERDGLKGCRLGRLANETEVLGDPSLQARLHSYFVRIEALLSASLRAAQADGTLPASLNVADTAALLAASVQGGFLLSRAKADREDVARATRGAWALLQASQSTKR